MIDELRRMKTTAGHYRIRCDLWKLGWDGCRGGPLIRKVPWSSIEQTEDFFEKTHLSFPRLFARCPHLDFFLGGSCESWVMQRWCNGGRHLGPTDLRLLPGGQVLLAASEDRRGGVRGFQERGFSSQPIYSLRMFAAVWWFQSEGCDGRLWFWHWRDQNQDGAWGQRWLSTVGVSCGFFSTMYQLKGKQLRNPPLDFCRRVQPLGGFRIYHCSKDIQTQGTPRSWFWCVCRSKNASLLMKWRVKDWWIWSIVNMKLFWKILIFCSHLNNDIFSVEKKPWCFLGVLPPISQLRGRLSFEVVFGTRGRIGSWLRVKAPGRSPFSRGHWAQFLPR